MDKKTMSQTGNGQRNKGSNIEYQNHLRPEAIKDLKNALEKYGYDIIILQEIRYTGKREINGRTQY